MVSWRASAAARCTALFNGVYLFGHPVPPPGRPGARRPARHAGPRALEPRQLPRAGTAGRSTPPATRRAHCGARIRRARGRHHPAPHRRAARRVMSASHEGLPVTSPAAHAASTSPRDGHPSLEAMIVRRPRGADIVTPSLITREIDARPAGPGIERLREIAGAEAAGFTRSRRSAGCAALCRQARLPQPLTNLRTLAAGRSTSAGPRPGSSSRSMATALTATAPSSSATGASRLTSWPPGIAVLRFTATAAHPTNCWVLGRRRRSLGTAQ